MFSTTPVSLGSSLFYCCCLHLFFPSFPFSWFRYYCLLFLAQISPACLFCLKFLFVWSKATLTHLSFPFDFFSDPFCLKKKLRVLGVSFSCRLRELFTVDSYSVGIAFFHSLSTLGEFSLHSHPLWMGCNWRLGFWVEWVGDVCIDLQVCVLFALMGPTVMGCLFLPWDGVGERVGPHLSKPY
jgi:hypothetical protein